MSKHSNTSAVIDGLLNFVVLGGTLSLGIIAPNSIQALDKPLQKYFQAMDKRQRNRELQRLTTYMKRKNLLENDYQHGLVLTKKGYDRARKSNINSLKIDTTIKWDHTWRIVLYDIPENHKNGRDTLTRKLRNLGFYQLQRSVWIHPFPCRREIEVLTAYCGIEKYVSYIETTYIDKQEILLKKFSLVGS